MEGHWQEQSKVIDFLRRARGKRKEALFAHGFGTWLKVRRE